MNDFIPETQNASALALPAKLKISIPQGGFSSGGTLLSEIRFFTECAPDVTRALNEQFGVTTRQGLTGFLRACTPQAASQIYNTVSVLCSDTFVEEQTRISRKALYCLAIVLDLDPFKVYHGFISLLGERISENWKKLFNKYRGEPETLQHRSDAPDTTRTHDVNQGSPERIVIVDVDTLRQLMQTVAELQKTVGRLERDIVELKGEPADVAGSITPSEAAITSQFDAGQADDPLIEIITNATQAALLPLDQALETVGNELMECHHLAEQRRSAEMGTIASALIDIKDQMEKIFSWMETKGTAEEQFRPAAADLLEPKDNPSDQFTLQLANHTVPSVVPSRTKDALSGNSVRQTSLVSNLSKDAEIFGEMVREFWSKLPPVDGSSATETDEDAFVKAMSSQKWFNASSPDARRSMLRHLQHFYRGELSPMNEAGNFRDLARALAQTLEITSHRLEEVPGLFRNLLWTDEIRTFHHDIRNQMTAAKVYTIAAIKNLLGILLSQDEEDNLLNLLKSRDPNDYKKAIYSGSRFLLEKAFATALREPTFRTRKRLPEPAV